MTESSRVIEKRTVGFTHERVPMKVSVQNWAQQKTTNVGKTSLDFILSLFPIISWSSRYNRVWCGADISGGVAVGIVLVPQCMSYARVATLPPQFGLYSGLVCSIVYSFFATSKDVSVGPVAVMGLLTANVINEVQNSHLDTQLTAPEIAASFSFFCGMFILAISFARMHWILEFISDSAVSSFVTGSAIIIATSQLPALLGLSGIDNHAPARTVIIQSITELPQISLDAFWGLGGLVSLYVIRIICEWLEKWYPQKAFYIRLIVVLRNSIVLIGLTFTSWIYCRNRKSADGMYPIKILQHVPSGMHYIAPPVITRGLLKIFASQLPAATVLILVQHIVTAESLGRMNGYKIDRSQEMIAVGVSNAAVSFFGTYPPVGSFSMSILKSKLKIHTPAAGFSTAFVVVSALYSLSKFFFWIPAAGLAAIIIIAVISLAASPSQLRKLYDISPPEFCIWVVVVVVTVLTNIQRGTYVSVGLSLVHLFYRLASQRGHFLRKVVLPTENSFRGDDKSHMVRIDIDDSGVNSLLPEVLVYGLDGSLTSANCSMVNDAVVDYVHGNICRCGDLQGYQNGRDLMWNESRTSLRFRGAGETEQQIVNERRPDLKAVVIDFSRVFQCDLTAVNSLVNTRRVINHWVGHPVDFHFAGISSTQVHDLLFQSGFGTGTPSFEFPRDFVLLAADPDDSNNDSETETYAPVMSTKTPFFHIDIKSAIVAAESGVARSRCLQVLTEDVDGSLTRRFTRSLSDSFYSVSEVLMSYKDNLSRFLEGYGIVR